MTIAILNIVAFTLLEIGALNWGLIAFFNWNLVSAIFGASSIVSMIIYSLVFLASLWLLFSLIRQRNKIMFSPQESENLEKSNYATNPATNK